MSLNFGSDFTLKVAKNWQLKFLQAMHTKLNEPKCFSNSEVKQEKSKYASSNSLKRKPKQRKFPMI